MTKSAASKDLILKISHENSGLIDPYSWAATRWRIYSNHQMIVKVDGWLGTTHDKTLQIALVPNEYQKILRLIQEIRHADREVLALDGTSWCIQQFQSGQLIYERPWGHIYGIRPFEALAHLLYRDAGLPNLD